MSKDREAFIALEFESRRITSALTDLAHRRTAVLKHSKNLVIGQFETLTTDFETWTISKSEELMVQLRDVVLEMSVLRRKVSDKSPDSELAFQMEQEYHRKLQLLETLKSLAEFDPGEDMEFFESFQAAWKCDSQYGCLTIQDGR